MTLISASFFKRSKLVFWCVLEFIILFVIDLLINIYFEYLFFLSIHIMMIVPFIILMIQRNKTLISLMKSLICISVLFIIISFIGNIFKIVTIYIPHHYSFYDVEIGIFIVLTSLLFFKYMRKEFQKFNLSEKSQLYFIFIDIFFILYFTIIYPLLLYIDSSKLHEAGTMIFILISLVFIKLFMNTLVLKKQKEICRNEYNIALNLKESIKKKEEFIINTKHYYKELITNIGYFIDLGKYTELQIFYNDKLINEYKEIVNQTDNTKDVLKILNYISENELLIKGLIYQYYVKAKGLKGVYVYLNINSYIDSFFIDEDDLFKILNIMFSNSIEELQSINSDYRNEIYTYLKIFIEKNNTEIKFIIQNSINTLDSKIDNSFEHFGKGIKIAKELERKYKNVKIQFIPQQKMYTAILEIGLNK